WKRDVADVFAFHVDVPAGTREVTARFVHTSPLTTGEGRITMTPEMLNLQWDLMSFYPAGHYVRQVKIRPTVTFPAGWRAFAALDGGEGPAVTATPKTTSPNTVTWAETDYETLVDSPIFAGLHAGRWDLGQNVAMNVVADDPKLLAIKPENIATYRNLVNEAVALYGSRHFDRYEFLLALTNRMGGIGLEHHRSSENQMEPTSWTDWSGMDWDRNVIPHELSHSWDGKFRRPAKLWTPDYRQPMGNHLLWVYEGQNQFWGYVLAARSGVQSKEVVLGQFASNAANFVDSPGRAWRSVEDTTLDPIMAARKPKPYASLTRGEDYYTEGALIWLEADQIIRAGTQGKKGMDDFAKAFFGIRDGDWGTVTYEFEDLVTTLNGIYPHDWATFLRDRIEQPGRPAPLAGIEQAGYRLVWRDTPNPFEKGRFADSRVLSLTWSLGITVDKDAKITAVRWGSPAFEAALVNGTKIVSVNGRAYDPGVLRDAITAAKGAPAGSPAPLQLVVQRGDAVRTVALDYRGGLRYPWLEKVPGKGPAGLDLLLTPRVPVGTAKAR
ncbi:MAG: M61 family metallopeptidase, partial [Sphingomonadales bacterium]|nr:M61 family metallopeptidase [Sphingomonadales bacterium]